MPKEAYMYAPPRLYEIMEYVVIAFTEQISDMYHVALVISSACHTKTSLHAISATEVQSQPFLTEKSIDTSMGLTPTEGLMMGTRCR